MQLPAQSNKELTRFKRIGLFDSGLGGLSVMRRLAELPDAASRSFVYVGDTARCPYGNRSAEEIAKYVDEIVNWLQRQEVDAIVMACNTSAAMARHAADKASAVPVFDLIGPTAELVSKLPGRIGVMATAATVRSRAFSKAINAFNNKADVLEYACPDLVPFVESGRVDSDECTAVLGGYVEQLRADNIQTVILGCTHFPFLRRSLERLAQDHLSFVDPAQILSGTSAHEGQPNYRCDLFVTGDTEAFARSAEICLGDIPFTTRYISVSALEACGTQSAFAMSAEVVSAPAVPTVVQ